MPSIWGGRRWAKSCRTPESSAPSGGDSSGERVRLFTGRALGHRCGAQCRASEDGDRRCGGNCDRKSTGKDEPSCMELKDRHRCAFSSSPTVRWRPLCRSPEADCYRENYADSLGNAVASSRKWCASAISDSLLSSRCGTAARRSAGTVMCSSDCRTGRRRCAQQVIYETLDDGRSRGSGSTARRPRTPSREPCWCNWTRRSAAPRPTTRCAW